MDNQERTSAEEKNINAALLYFELNEEIEKLRSEPGWEKKDRHSITLQKDENLRVVLMALHKGTIWKDHKADGAISVLVISGKIIFSVGDEKTTLEKNGLVVLDKPIIHRVEALEETNLLLTVVRVNKE
ncbi:MAG: cupin domain-containing protein [Syntrophothermus sp.]